VQNWVELKVWSRIGVHFFKPAADVEAGVARTWHAGEDGAWLVELRIAALDAFSDVVFVGLGVDPRDVQAQLDHEGRPLAARAFIERRERLWRVELHGGGSTVARSRAAFSGGGAAPFDLTERVGFAGALLEVTPAAGLSRGGRRRACGWSSAPKRWAPTSGNACTVAWGSRRSSTEYGTPTRASTETAPSTIRTARCIPGQPSARRKVGAVATLTLHMTSSRSV